MQLSRKRNAQQLHVGAQDLEHGVRFLKDTHRLIPEQRNQAISVEDVVPGQPNRLGLVPHTAVTTTSGFLRDVAQPNDHAGGVCRQVNLSPQGLLYQKTPRVLFAKRSTLGLQSRGRDQADIFNGIDILPALSLTAARSRGKGRGFPLQDGHVRPQPLSRPYSQQA